MEKIKITATRNSLQLTRRAFHLLIGVSIGLIYQFSLTHSQAIYILGFAASLLYFLEQIRINYPEISSNIVIINKYLLRAEEQLRESASIPYIMGILLTFISFPKAVSLISIYTLAIGDPLSAIIGIKYGKRKWKHGGKSKEGSLAFFIVSILVNFIIINWSNSLTGNNITNFTLIISITLISSISTVFEYLPIKIDDNLTIPLFTAVTSSLIFFIFNTI